MQMVVDKDRLERLSDENDRLIEACTRWIAMSNRLGTENDRLRELFVDFWTWADPPFALKSGTFDQFMEIAERAREMGLVQ